MPSKLSSQRESLLSDVIETWSRLPSMDEKLARLGIVLEECGPELGNRVKPLIESCLSGYDVDSESRSTQGRRIRALVELAYKIDEEWAASLVSVADQDPAREIARLEAREGIEGLRLSKAIAEPKEGAKIEGTSRNVAAACYRQLGVISGSGSTALGWQDIVHRLSACPLGDLRESYPVIAFSMAVFATKYRGTSGMRDRAEMLVRAVNEAIVVAGALGGASGESSSKAGLSEMLSGEVSFQRLAKSGERAEIISALAAWLSRRAPPVLEIIDPYLRVEDIVSILSLVKDSCPTTAVRVLTSTKVLPKPWSDESLEREVRQHWTDVRQGRDMPTSVLIATGISSGEMPVHDRWWLCGEEGIWFGTSFGSLGVDKLSGMKPLDGKGVAEVRVEVNPYLSMIARQFKDEKLKYISLVC